MAELLSSSAASSQKRKRSPNFTRDEVLRLEELVTRKENLDLLSAKFSSSVTNRQKNQLWEAIAVEVSAVGVFPRTSAECSNKWQNLKREAKEAHTEDTMEMRRTGGGPKKRIISEQHARIIDVFGETPSFSGITGGTDSDELDGKSFIPNLPTEEAEERLDLTQPGPYVKTTTAFKTKLNEHKKTKERKISQEDLAAVQMRYFEGEIANQALVAEKLQLQIKLLRRMDAKDETLSAQELFASLPFLSQ